MQLDETKFQHEASLQERRMQMEQQSHATDEALKIDQHEHNKEMAEKQARSENFQTAFSDDEGEEAK